MTRRRLTSDEISLWRKVAETTEKMHPERAHKEPPLPKPTPKKKVKTLLQEFQIGQSARPKYGSHKTASPIAQNLTAPPLQMDAKSFTRMKRGKLGPEARIDLHGMTLDQAHPELLSFILTSQAMGRRLVLVITGKGKPGNDRGPIPTRHGILKHYVPQWLKMPPLTQAVLQVSEAHLKHGGSGAYYVYLKKRR